jgi:hypothetical protein
MVTPTGMGITDEMAKTPKAIIILWTSPMRRQNPKKEKPSRCCGRHCAVTLAMMLLACESVCCY